MPLSGGSSRSQVAKDFHEIRHGKTYAKTSKKFGRKVANRQMEAIVLSNQRKKGRKRASRKRA